jgi:hypothetical protein
MNSIGEVADGLFQDSKPSPQAKFIRAIIVAFCFNTTLLYFFLQARENVQQGLAEQASLLHKSLTYKDDYSSVTSAMALACLKTVIVNFIINLILRIVPTMTKFFISPNNSIKNLRMEHNPMIDMTTSADDSFKNNTHMDIPSPAIDFYAFDGSLFLYVCIALVLCAILNYYVGKSLTATRKVERVSVQRLQSSMDIIIFGNYILIICASCYYVYTNYPGAQASDD